MISYGQEPGAGRPVIRPVIVAVAVERMDGRRIRSAVIVM